METGHRARHELTMRLLWVVCLAGARVWAQEPTSASAGETEALRASMHAYYRSEAWSVVPFAGVGVVTAASGSVLAFLVAGCSSRAQGGRC